MSAAARNQSALPNPRGSSSPSCRSTRSSSPGAFRSDDPRTYRSKLGTMIDPWRTRAADRWSRQCATLVGNRLLHRLNPRLPCRTVARLNETSLKHGRREYNGCASGRSAARIHQPGLAPMSNHEMIFSVTFSRHAQDHFGSHIMTTLARRSVLAGLLTAAALPLTLGKAKAIPPTPDLPASAGNGVTPAHYHHLGPGTVYGTSRRVSRRTARRTSRRRY